MRYYRQRQAPVIKPHESDIETLDHMRKVHALLAQYNTTEKITPKRAQDVAAIFLKRVEDVQTRSFLGVDSYVTSAWEQLRKDAQALAQAAEERCKDRISSAMASIVLQLDIILDRIGEAEAMSPEGQLHFTILVALQLEAPAIEQEFIDAHRGSFDRLAALNDWRGVSRGQHGEWARQELNGVLRVCDYAYTRDGGQTVVFNDERAAKVAQEYAAAIVLEMAHKMSRKLGALTQVEIAMLRPGAKELTLHGRRGEHRVTVSQQRVSHYNQNGTYYQQYPALIYVNGSRVSEAEYKARK